jgi:hypothetical protein
VCAVRRVSCYVFAHQLGQNGQELRLAACEDVNECSPVLWPRVHGEVRLFDRDCDGDSLWSELVA